MLKRILRSLFISSWIAWMWMIASFAALNVYKEEGLTGVWLIVGFVFLAIFLISFFDKDVEGLF